MAFKINIIFDYYTGRDLRENKRFPSWGGEKYPDDYRLRGAVARGIATSGELVALGLLFYDKPGLAAVSFAISEYIRIGEILMHKRYSESEKEKAKYADAITLFKEMQTSKSKKPQDLDARIESSS